MNFLGGLKSKITGIYKTSPNDEFYVPSSSNKLDYEDIQHTLNVLQEENKILKSKVRILENSLFDNKSSVNQTNSESSTQFGKIFKEIKSTILYNTDEEPQDNLHNFKRFLYDNMLFHGSIDEEDSEFLNNIQISDENWEKRKEVYLFKQRVLEKNYSDMFRNLLVSTQLNAYLKSKGMTININEANPRKDSPVEGINDNPKSFDYKEAESNPKFVAKSELYDNYEFDSVKKIDQNVKKENTSDAKISEMNNPSANFNNNKSISPIISNMKKEKPLPNLGIENKLLTDLIIIENNEDVFVNNQTNTRTERNSIGRSNVINNNNSNTVIQDKEIPKASPVLINKRISVTPNLIENPKEDLSISSLLSDNNLATSINLNDNIKKNQTLDNENIFQKKPLGIIENVKNKENNDNKEGLNITNLLSSLNTNGKTSNTQTTTTTKMTSTITNNIKSDNKKSTLQFDDDDDDGFTFGSILNSAKTQKEKISITKSSLNNNLTRINDNKQDENLFESNILNNYHNS